MAESAARRKKHYSTSGSVAYQEHSRGSTVRAPSRQRVQPEPKSRPQVQPRRRIRPRPRVEVRQAGEVAIFSVAGFLAVALCAALLVMSCAELAMINDQAVQLKNDLAELQAENAKLTAQYELAYDLSTIEQQLLGSGKMIKLQPSQITYLDISAPDSVIVYGAGEQGFGSLLKEVKDFLTQLMSPHDG